MLCLCMTRERTSSPASLHRRKPPKTRPAPHSHNTLSSQLHLLAGVSAENSHVAGTRPSLRHRTRRIKFHRRNSIETRKRAQKRPRNASIFNRLQQGVQLIENTRYQPASFHTHAHSSPVSPVFATLTQNTPGVWVPLDGLPRRSRRRPEANAG